MNKNLIHDRFAKSLSNYDQNAKVQKNMAERLIGFIQNRNVDKILEIGCGTGFLTKLINENLEYLNYKAVDIVGDCEFFIKNIDSRIEFISSDIETFLANSDEKFDLIVSNASLQWIDDLENFVKILKTHLNDGGELVFSTFGKENFREIFHIMGTSLKYFSPKELLEMFSVTNVYVEEEIRIMAFENPKEVLRHLQLTGVNAIESKAWTRKDLSKFENAYLNLCSRRPTLTYNPIYLRITH